MSQPRRYTPSYDFSDFQASNPTTPLPGAQVDAQLDAIATTTDEICDNLALIQRDDGELANGSVGVDQLDLEARRIMNGWDPRGAWATATAYLAKDVVTNNSVTYVATEEHTSGVFSTDLAAGKWMAITDMPEDAEIVATGGTADRALADRFADQLNLKDMGAAGTGDDTTAITAAEASSRTDFHVPPGVYSTTDAASTLDKNYHGPGQIETAGNKRGKFFSAIKAAPASEGNHNSVETAFNGDLSHSIFQHEHRITGAATLGQPATGYKVTPEAYANYTVLYNSSGWNEETGGNDGRTLAAAYRVFISQFGQGDCAAYNARAFVTGTKAGSTDFLANPAASLFSGGMSAGADGVYLNARELVLDDGGYDIACIGDVTDMNRTNATGAKNVWWAGYRVQSKGSAPIDVAVSVSGPVARGVDLVPADLGAGKAALIVSSGDRLYLNGTATDTRFADNYGDDYIQHANDGIETVVDGAARQIVTANGVGIGAAPGASTPLRIVRSGGANAISRIEGAAGSVRYDLWKSSDDAESGEFYSLKTRANFSAVQSGDDAMTLTAAAWDGSTSRILARIKASVDGTPGSGDMPGRWTFATAADGGTTLTERLRIDSTGALIHRNNAQMIITAESHWVNRAYTVATLPSASVTGAQVYVSNGTDQHHPAWSDGSAWRYADGTLVV